MGKVVAVLSNDVGGNDADAIVNSVLDGAMGLSTNIIKLYKLQTMKDLKGCDGCLKCKADNRCRLDDDLTTVLSDIRDADCAVLSTPVVFNGPCAQYKMLEDRMISYLDENDKPVFNGKNAVLVVTCSKEDEGRKVADALTYNLVRLGFTVCDTIVYSDREGKAPASENTELLLEAKRIGSKFEGVNRDRRV